MRGCASTILRLNSPPVLGTCPYAAKAGVRAGAVGGIGASRPNAIPVAIGLVTQEGPAFHHPAGALWRTLGIQPVRVAVKCGVEPVRAPLPGISSNGVEAETVRRKRVGGGNTRAAVASH